jgi:hypothetical protein
MSALPRLRRLLIIPDAHIPYHDKKAWKTMLAAAKGFKPDDIVIMGDFGDCAKVSFHERVEGARHSFQEEMYQVEMCLDELDALGAKRKFYIMGNHEFRLSRYIANKASELEGLVSYDELVHLKERHWKVTPYRQTLRLGKLSLTHDLGKSGLNAHRDAEMVIGGNVGIGHVHTMNLSILGNKKGPHVAFSPGWLGRFKDAEYMPLDKAYRTWAHGFSTVHMEADGSVHVQMHPIFMGKTCVEGTIYRG